MARSFWLCLTAAIACGVSLSGCEDNPDQFYKQAPAGAGERWNDGQTNPYADPHARNGFTENFNSTTKQELCSGPVKQKRWAEMVKAPIKPPRFIGGLDLAGGDAWTGLDFRDAEKVNCQSKSTGGDESTLAAQWGDAGEIEVTYKLSNNTIDFIQLNQGYRGTLDFESRPDVPGAPNPFGQHKYSIGVGVPVRRDGQPWEIKWASPTWNKQATELYDALMYTFSPTLPGDQNDCIKAATCLARQVGGGAAVFGARPIGIYMHIPSISAPPPAPSTPDYLYAFYVKLMPFSTAEMFVKLDEEGPVAKAANLGDREPRANCVMKLGQTYATFLDGCVDVLKDPAGNDYTRGKLLGGLAHTKENFTMSVEGVNLDFSSNAIGRDKVIGDDWKPTADDEASQFILDIRASGRMLNDWSKPHEPVRAAAAIPASEPARLDPAGSGAATCAGGTPSANGKCCAGGAAPSADGMCCESGATPTDNLCCAKGALPHSGGMCCGAATEFAAAEVNYGGTCSANTFQGTGAIYREYARIVQNDLHKQMRELKGADWHGFGIGAPECLYDGSNPDTWRPAPGCTGFEGFVTPAAPDTTDDAGVKKVSLGAKNALSPAFGFKSALKPGDPIAMFCADPGTYDYCGNGDYLGYRGSLFDGSYKRVLDYLGGGDPLRLPAAARDRKYFFKLWARAMVKYLKAAHTYPTDLGRPEYGPGGTACGNFSSGCEPEPDHMLFDQVGLSGDREKFEYIDRRFVTADREPTKYEYESLLISGNQQDSRFVRRMTRPERALYQTMSKDRTVPPGAGNDLRITNLVGSPILANVGWAGVPGNPKKDAHYCASTLIDGKPDAECEAIGSTPPRDSKHGNAYLRDDYGNPILTNYRGAFTGTPFTIGSHHLRLIETLPFIKSAKIGIPRFSDPYGTLSFSSPSASAAAPDDWVLADWRPKTPADGIRIPVNAQRDRFVPSATANFTGSSLSLDIDYDLEPDGKTMVIEAVQSDEYMGDLFLCQDPVTQDLLRVEQYESMETVMTWIAQHPGVYEACDILIRYSAFNNFPVMLAAKKAGIVLNVGQGSGVGRITHIEIYDPAL